MSGNHEIGVEDYEAYEWTSRNLQTIIRDMFQKISFHESINGRLARNYQEYSSHCYKMLDIPPTPSYFGSQHGKVTNDLFIITLIRK